MDRLRSSFTSLRSSNDGGNDRLRDSMRSRKSKNIELNEKDGLRRSSLKSKSKESSDVGGSTSFQRLRRRLSTQSQSLYSFDGEARRSTIRSSIGRDDRNVDINSYRDSRCMPNNPLSLSNQNFAGRKSSMDMRPSYNFDRTPNENGNYAPPPSMNGNRLTTHGRLQGRDSSENLNNIDQEKPFSEQTLSNGGRTTGKLRKFREKFNFGRRKRNGKAIGKTRNTFGVMTEEGYTEGYRKTNKKFVPYFGNIDDAMQASGSTRGGNMFDVSRHSSRSLKFAFGHNSKIKKKNVKNKKKKKWFSRLNYGYATGSSAKENEEAFLADSISWFGRHVPDCVLSSFFQPLNTISEKMRLSVPDAEAELMGGNGTSEMVATNLAAGGDRESESLDIDDEFNGLQRVSILSTSSDYAPGRNSKFVDFKALPIPHSKKYFGALLFVDISGFTKLSTLLDVETLSKVINSYFQVIVNTITDCRGDILKFAGDAVFAEWTSSGLSDDFEKRMEDAVMNACCCAATIVETCSDYPVFKNIGVGDQGEQVATLNVHCGVGFGKLTGVHVGDDEKRREYLILGDPINQVARAESAADHGEVMASPEVISILEEICQLDKSLQDIGVDEPGLIASRKISHFRRRFERQASDLSFSTVGSERYFERIQERCEGLPLESLKKLRNLLSLYVHPVTRNDEMHASHHPTSRRTTEERHRAEAELRTVYVIFVNVEVEVDPDSNEKGAFDKLNDVLNLTTSVLDEHKGHLRQFIVDDKGVVLIATFGLRGSSTMNMVTENALPATLTLHKRLYEDLEVENKIGATLGKAYCGVVGGVRRHEYAVLGPTVNLAARLMANRSNPGVLVDNNVHNEAGECFKFCALSPVQAKGYAEPVPIFEPLKAVEQRWEKARKGFIGRKDEMMRTLQIAKKIVFSPTGSRMVLISGESGVGKSTFLSQAAERLKKLALMKKNKVVITRKVVKESEKLVPFSTFRTIFLKLLKEYDQDDKVDEDNELRLSISQHGFLRNNGLDLSTHGGGFMAHSTHRKANVYMRHLADAEDLSLSSTEESGSGSVMTSLEKLRLICIELEETRAVADICAKYLGIVVEDMEEAKKLPKMDKIIQFMVSSFIRSVKRASLVVIALDDVHHIDSLSWKILRKLYEEGRNIMIVCSSRPLSSVKQYLDEDMLKLFESGDNNHEDSKFSEIVLRPFDRVDVRQLVLSATTYSDTDIDVDEAFVNFVYDHSGGMPHFSREIIDAIMKTNISSGNNSLIFDREKIARTSNVFSSMDQMILHTMDSLDQEIRQIVQICSILGREFDLNDLVLVHKPCIGMRYSGNHEEELEFTKPKLDGAIKARIIEIAENDDSLASDSSQKLHTYRFRLDVFRLSVINSMLESRRKDLHGIVAKAIKAYLKKHEIADNFDFTGMIKLFNHLKASDDSANAASTALKIGKKFENLGLSSQSLELYRDTLGIWTSKNTSKENSKNNIGGIDLIIIQSMGPTDLDYLIRLKIETGKCFANVHNGFESSKTYKEAHQILEEAPASEELENHAMLFPIFSGLCLALKWGRLKDDESRSYEQEVVARFVHEAKVNGDPVHEARALAMQGVMFYNLGLLDKCLQTQSKLDEVYDVKRHSKGICKAYGSDRAAQNYGLCAQWHELLNNYDEMFKTIEFILGVLLPEMEERNVHNQFMLLYPMLIVMKGQGMATRALNIFEKHVVKMFEEHYGSDASTFCLAMYKPTVNLLKLLAARDENYFIDDETWDEIIEWALLENTGTFKTDLESVTVNLGRDGIGAVAEICLLLTTNEISCSRMNQNQRSAIIEKGLELANKSIERSANNVGFQYAFKEVKVVQEQLEELKAAS